MNLKQVSLFSFILLSFINQILFSQVNDSLIADISKMELEQLMNTKVSIATKSEQPAGESPSIVSVITSEEILNIGARELEDILQLIPGFEPVRNYGGYYTIGIRGVKDLRTTSKILIMIDGTPINQIYYGNYLDWGYNINIEAIDRIEIIRGPGSALYGRNAFSAVINVISKKGINNEDIIIKASIGTFNSKSISANYGFSKNKLSAFISAKKIYTNVANSEMMDRYGEILEWNIYKNNFSINSNVTWGKFTFNGVYYDLKGGTINDTKIFNRVANYSITYEDIINTRLSLSAKLFGQNSLYIEDIVQIKADFNHIIPGYLGGNDTLRFADIYPEGICYKPENKGFITGFETEIKYKLFSGNNLLFGLQGDYHGVYDVRIKSNYNFATGLPFPGKTRENMDYYEPGWFENNEHYYNNFAIILQDVWQPFDKVDITLGGRYDLESEIGGVFSPRFGLIIKPVQNFDIKCLFGKAYRAPSPSEQYPKLGYAIGNKDLKPEIINTYELAMIFRTSKMENSISFYNNRLRDMIYADKIIYIDPKNKYYNIGQNKSTGIEFENKIILGKKLYTLLNYSYTISKNTYNDSTYSQPDIAPHKLNFNFNYYITQRFTFNINMFYRSKMEKFQFLDPETKLLTKAEKNIGNYAIFNSTIRANKLIKHFDLSASIYNIFNTAYYSQDNQNVRHPSQPGRQIIFNISYTFKN